MSNPTIATKLTSLIKGIFGRKDPVVTTVQDKKKDETPAAETAETAEKTGTPAETAEAPTEATAEKSDRTPDGTPVDEAGEESAQDKPASEEAETGKEAEDQAEAATTEAPEAAELVEEPRDEPSTPATADVPEDGPALAEEMQAAEAHTTVASDDVLEKVRKGAAPAVEDLAVPTYDELTMPSVRARLRKLTIEQVRDLRAYEVAHQGRPEFIKMYDNRIAKLEAEV